MGKRSSLLVSDDSEIMDIQATLKKRTLFHRE